MILGSYLCHLAIKVITYMFHPSRDLFCFWVYNFCFFPTHCQCVLSETLVIDSIRDVDRTNNITDRL